MPLIADKVLLPRRRSKPHRRDGFAQANVFNGLKLDRRFLTRVSRRSRPFRPVSGLRNTTVVPCQKTVNNGTAVIFEGINPAAWAPPAGGVGFLFGAGYGFQPERRYPGRRPRRHPLFRCQFPGTLPFLVRSPPSWQPSRPVVRAKSL